ncbi:uncharacterized protein J3R85_016553 [Psidium guajava]|nr:uncharacterized protein J3R85_016553 [Psidium guajava]
MKGKLDVTSLPALLSKTCFSLGLVRLLDKETALLHISRPFTSSSSFQLLLLLSSELHGHDSRSLRRRGAPPERPGRHRHRLLPRDRPAPSPLHLASLGAKLVVNYASPAPPPRPTPSPMRSTPRPPARHLGLQVADLRPGELRRHPRLQVPHHRLTPLSTTSIRPSASMLEGHSCAARGCKPAEAGRRRQDHNAVLIAGWRSEAEHGGVHLLEGGGGGRWSRSWPRSSRAPHHRQLRGAGPISDEMFFAGRCRPSCRVSWPNRCRRMGQ